MLDLNERVAVAFNNKFGNFLWMSTSVKVLRSWGYKNIVLLTDDDYTKKPWADLVFDVFDDVITFPTDDKFEHIFVARWSIPWGMYKYPHSTVHRNYSDRVSWKKAGVHEIQVYMNMIGASWNDFNGYPDFELHSGVVLDTNKPMVALANCSGPDARVKQWNQFPKLSELLVDLGFEVVLLGVENELSGCVGMDFVGKLKLKETMSVLSQCDLLIATSTGLAVAADALGVPMVLIEGPIMTSKTHPVVSKYSVVRKHVSCAPCYQTILNNICDNPVCMNEIMPGDVIDKAAPLLKYRDVRQSNVISIPMPKFEVKPVPNVECHVAYLVSCFNRAHQLARFLDSFNKSEPQEGVIVFTEDASYDPRVAVMLENYRPPEQIDKVILYTDIVDKTKWMNKHSKNITSFVHNKMFEAAVRYNKKEVPLDYVFLIDSDALMKPYWVQTLVHTYKGAVDNGFKIGYASAFNNVNHPIYDNCDQTIYKGEFSKFRLRNGCNLQYMMTYKFMLDHGKYSYKSSAFSRSTDLTKNEELTNKGFKSLILVPSMLQHIGAFDSSFDRIRSNEIVYDF